jgi:hypothetical protein
MGVMIDRLPGSNGPEKIITSVPDIDAFRSDELTNSDVRPSVEVELPLVEVEQPAMASSPPQWTERQIGGNHYQKLKIQPATYIRANRLGFFEGNIVKLVSRFEDKGGLEDLDKLIHYAQMLREEYAKELQEESDG